MIAIDLSLSPEPTMEHMDADGRTRHDAIADALRAAPFATHLSAFGYRLTYSETLGPSIHVALVLDRDAWDPETSQAAKDARSTAAIALAHFDMAVLLNCRTRLEHAEFAATEVDTWTLVDHRVAC